MPVVTVQTETLITIYHSFEEREIGVTSRYGDAEHPGSNKKIEGWKWDKRTWPTSLEFDAAEFAPTLWDAAVSGLDEALFQSGFGDQNDLLLLGIERSINDEDNIWAPKVNRGYFYTYNEEWYLYSDWHQTEVFTLSNVISGQQYLDLNFRPKPTVPIQVRGYNFNSVLGRHFVSTDVPHRVEFTSDTPEYRIDDTFDPPRLWLDSIVNEAVGNPVTVVSGVPDSSDILELEIVGISDGSIDQEFFLDFSPVDSFAEFEVWTYNTPAGAEQWATISGVDEFTLSGQQVHIDYDRGIISFGDHDSLEMTGSGLVPTFGHKIGVHYTKAVAAMYEPDFGQDFILARTADVNPTAGTTYQGFVQVLTQSSDPASIELTAELPGTVNPSFLIDLGNNTGRLVATVKDSAGQELEGETVSFELLSPVVGTFGASTSVISSITNAEGDAKTTYNAPSTIEDVGQPTIDLTVSGVDSVLNVIGLTDPGSVSGLYLYKIHETDSVLGISDDEISGFYTDYFSDEDITDGTVATQSWEEEHRTINVLGKPITYDPLDDDDLRIGKKTAILTSNIVDVVDPHTGLKSLAVLTPLFATTVTDTTGTSDVPSLQLTYTGTALPDISMPLADPTKAYFVVGDAKTRVRAFVTNRRTGKQVFSNTINIKVSIPDEVTGTFFADLLSDAPSGLLTKTRNIDDVLESLILATSGVNETDTSTFHDAWLAERLWDTVSGYEDYQLWFRRTRRGDTRGLTLADLGLEEIAIDSAILNQQGSIPLGFRLKSTGITLASVLDQITYLDPNDNLPSGYFGV